MEMPSCIKIAPAGRTPPRPHPFHHRPCTAGERRFDLNITIRIGRRHVELANDQITPISYVTQNIDRNPTLSSTSGNNVWVNYQQYGSGTGSWNTTNSPVGSSIKNGLANFYPGTSTFVFGFQTHPNAII